MNISSGGKRRKITHAHTSTHTHTQSGDLKRYAFVLRKENMKNKLSTE